MLGKNVNEGNCIVSWVSGVSNHGTFVKNKESSFDIGENGIPYGWEVIDEATD